MASSTQIKIEKIKILVLGESGVGKSCIIQKYAYDVFKQGYVSTIGLDFKSKQLEIEGGKIKMHIWDTAGQEKFHSIPLGHYKDSQGIMVVYDVRSCQSFERLQYWFDKIKQHAPEKVEIMVLGNKSDDSSQRKVTYQQGYNFCKERGVKFLQVSAKTSSNIAYSFEQLATKIVKNMQLIPKAQNQKQFCLRKKQTQPKKSSCLC